MWPSETDGTWSLCAEEKLSSCFQWWCLDWSSRGARICHVWCRAPAGKLEKHLKVRWGKISVHTSAKYRGGKKNWGCSDGTFEGSDDRWGGHVTVLHRLSSSLGTSLTWKRRKRRPGEVANEPCGYMKVGNQCQISLVQKKLLITFIRLQLAKLIQLHIIHTMLQNKQQMNIFVLSMGHIKLYKLIQGN